MEYLDPSASHRLSGRYDRGYLPHLRAQGGTYFVTVRLEGTLPQQVLREFQKEREALVAKVIRNSGAMSVEDERRLSELYSEKIEAYLDAGRGDCWLKDAAIAGLVVGALQFFHRQRYELGSWVVMPNHVHFMVRPLGGYLLDQILKNCKGFSAREANKLLRRTGQSFWAREYYDRLVRDDAERALLEDYIHDNPVKAGLCARWEDWRWSSAYRP